MGPDLMLYLRFSNSPLSFLDWLFVNGCGKRDQTSCAMHAGIHDDLEVVQEGLYGS